MKSFPFLLAAISCSAQIITTVAGTGTAGFSGDGGPAIAAKIGGGFGSSTGVAADAGGNFYIADQNNNRIRKVGLDGIIKTVAGGGGAIDKDGVQATSINFFPSNVATDSNGNIFIVAAPGIRKVTPDGIITTVAGSGFVGYSGDGGLATKAQVFPSGVAVDKSGQLFIADSMNNLIRKVDTAGIITTYAGTPGKSGYSGDGGPAKSATLNLPQGIAVDNAGNVYFADNATHIRKVDTSGIITTVGGNGSGVGVGENVSATATGMNPVYVAVDGGGNLFYAEPGTSRIRKISTAGLVTTVAGTLVPGALGDGGPATSATLNGPSSVSLDAAGNLYIADSNNFRIRKVAGVGVASSSGTPNGSFSTNPIQLNFTYTLGDPNPASQTATISSTGDPIAFAVAATSQGSNWLSINTSSGTTPANITASVNPTGLGVGVYVGSIACTAPGTAGRNVPVSLQVKAAGVVAAPIIGAIVNATGYQAKLAPDTVFTVFGSNLGPASIVLGQTNYTTNLGGTSISFVPSAGGTAIPAKIVYTVGGQVAALLPSSITPGTYTANLTYNGQTGSFQNVIVVARSFGIATANSAGTGNAQASIGNVNNGVSLVRFTTGNTTFNGLNYLLAPAHPGDTLVLWGTGGGADAKNDAGGTSGDQTAAVGFSVNVEGRQITPLYSGASSGYPGLWQINFTLPNDITPNCFAPTQVTAGGELSNIVTIAIAATGTTTCSDPDIPAAILSRIDSGKDVTIAGFSVYRMTLADTGTVSQAGSGNVAHYPPGQYAAAFAALRINECRIRDRTLPDGPYVDAFLDAGSPLPLTGPNLSAALTTVSSTVGPAYDYSPGSNNFGSGTYTLKGNAGSQVGPFTASTIFPTSFTATSLDTISSVDRTKPLTLNWVGSGYDQVALGITVYRYSGLKPVSVVSVTCTVPGTLNSYTIPASVLSYLPAGTPVQASIGMQALSASGLFTASLTSGGSTDIGSFSATLGFGKSITVQ
jgi:uncharacterized protein (TIGR03437 family)